MSFLENLGTGIAMGVTFGAMAQMSKMMPGFWGNGGMFSYGPSIFGYGGFFAGGCYGHHHHHHHCHSFWC